MAISVNVLRTPRMKALIDLLFVDLDSSISDRVEE